MSRYTLCTSESYDDEDDERTGGINRIGGAPLGLSSEDWPRFEGRPMQHAFTIELEPLELDVPRAAEACALAVFLDSYYELDLGASPGVTVIWLTEEQIDAHPETTPPADFVAEKLPGHESMDEEGEYYEGGSPIFELEEVDEDEDEGEFGDSFIGGAPAWHEDIGEPEDRPEGAFVLQVMSHEFPVCRVAASLFVFEGGAYIQAEDPEDEDQQPTPWPEAIAASRELVVEDGPPPAGALQKWGGIPLGINAYDWPKTMSHILTWVPPSFPEDSEAVAFALFGRLSKTDNWDEELSFYEVREITQDDLDAQAEEDEAFELPAGAELLPERAITLRVFPADTSWRTLQTANFVGPRPAWRAPDRRSAEDLGEGTVLQLTEALLPVSPGAGSLHALGGYPVWHAAPGTEQAQSERYTPDGTLYEGDTCAGIVVGWRLSFSDSLLPEQVEALERTLLAALATRGHKLRLYVPGDTSTDRNATIYASLVLGRAVVMTEANDYEPSSIDPAKVAAALAGLPDLDASFWREALAFSASVEPPDAAAAYLLSWGPLCYAATYVGVAANNEDTPVYTFVANQDMNQEWSSQGIDGVVVQGADFSDVAELELEAGHLAKVEKLDAAGFWLICRYD